MSPKLLVSVRSVDEAEEALVGGADLIDVKEPARGALGRADDGVISDIVRFVAGRAQVSAALGEWREWDGRLPKPKLDYVKWGLSRCEADFASLQSRLDCQLRRSTSPKGVLVAYADWQRADAPEPLEVVAFLAKAPGSILLVDTFSKDGRNLLDWKTVAEIRRLCEDCRESAIAIALAGSLGIDEIALLKSSMPDWFGVRGAACQGGRREGRVERKRVADLKELIRNPACGLALMANP